MYVQSPSPPDRRRLPATMTIRALEFYSGIGEPGNHVFRD